MNFKDIKPGIPVYILTRCEGRTHAFTGSVISASAPHFDNNSLANGMPNSQLIIDFVIEYDGNRKQFCIPESSSVSTADNNNFIVCADKEHFLREVEARKAQAGDILKTVEQQRQTVADCEEIIAEYDNTFKEKKQVEERFNSLESSLKELTEIVKRIAAN